MDTHKIENQFLNKIAWSLDGSTVLLCLTSINDPKKNITIECKNIVFIQMHRMIPDSVPYYIGEVVCTNVNPTRALQLLREYKYEHLNNNGDVYCDKSIQLMHMHLEGALCFDMLAENIIINNQDN